jgi:sulfite exporter TauE/SafE
MSSSEALYLTFLATGFIVGFGHCIGMCGPIVVSFSLNLKPNKVMAPNLLYHVGRISTYAILGGAMGATGAFTRISAGIGGVQKRAMMLAGLVIMGMEIQNTFKASLAGMGLMTVFGVGTIPALLLVARLAGMGWLKSREMI